MHQATNLGLLEQPTWTPQMSSVLRWRHIFTEQAKKHEVIKTLSAQMAKIFAKNAQPPPAWAAQAGRSSALWHGWRCFPLPACNLPCTLPGEDSSSSQILSQHSTTKMRAVKSCRRLEETEPSRAAGWVPPSVLISHQIKQQGTGEHPRKIDVSWFGSLAGFLLSRGVWSHGNHCVNSHPGSQGCSLRGK